MIDLLVVGLGPTGAVLAGLAALRGLSVVVVERDAEVFDLPRAVQCDHEVLRILQELGIAEEILEASIINEGLDFVAADHSTLLSFNVPPNSASAWPTSVFFHQPSFEAVLRRRVAELGAELRLGVEVIELGQDEESVSARLSDGSTLTAHFCVGADGARSLTRAAIGGGVRDFGFEEDWLVVDLILADEVEGLPGRCVQVCDPARPHTLVPMPGKRFRFEFMLLDGEDGEELRSPESVARLISPWMDSSVAAVERAAIYTFHGLVAERWRDRRILIAGDAAHQTPPFIGQGMCAGMRDAANLAWKLRAVLSGAASEGLLDSYQAEREPHAWAVIGAAVGFGQWICTTDPVAAAERDEQMRALAAGAGDAPEMLPSLEEGQAIGPGGGSLSVQPLVDGRRLDELVGTSFVVVSRVEPGDEQRRLIEGAGLLLSATDELESLLGEAEATCIRPDRYVLARGSLEEVVASLGRIITVA